MYTNVHKVYDIAAIHSTELRYKVSVKARIACTCRGCIADHNVLIIHTSKTYNYKQ